MRGNELIPGAGEFLDRLHQRQIKFLILTNNPQYTPVDLQYRLQRIGLNLHPITFTPQPWQPRSFSNGRYPMARRLWWAKAD